MSYIIEALKKAQREKNGYLLNYTADEKTDSRGGTGPGRKALYYSIFIPCIALLVFLSYSWLGLSIERHSREKGSGVSASTEEPIPEVGAEALYERAGRLYREGNFPEAKELYEAALSLDPGHIEALNNLGVIYIRDGNYTRAEELLEKAVRLRPSYVDPYYNLACLHAVKGDKAQGLAYLKKSLSIDGNVKAWARDDSDLENLKTLPEFKNIISDKS